MCCRKKTSDIQTQILLFEDIFPFFLYILFAFLVTVNSPPLYCRSEEVHLFSQEPH